MLIEELMMHCQGKIDISVSGYATDPRELFEIEEVREYIALLDEALPELFFFARTEEPATTLMFFLFSLAGVSWEDERSTPGNPQKYIIDYATLGPFLTRHFTYLNYISEFLGLSEQEVKAISMAAAKTMQCLPPEADTP